MVREAVRSEMVMPSILRSPWIRGARQSGLAVAIRSISRRISAAVAGRPAGGVISTIVPRTYESVPVVSA